MKIFKAVVEKIVESKFFHPSTLLGMSLTGLGGMLGRIAYQSTAGAIWGSIMGFLLAVAVIMMVLRYKM